LFGLSSQGLPAKLEQRKKEYFLDIPPKMAETFFEALFCLKVVIFITASKQQRSLRTYTTQPQPLFAPVCVLVYRQTRTDRCTHKAYRQAIYFAK
jgi:hypothetical protein